MTDTHRLRWMGGALLAAVVGAALAAGFGFCVGAVANAVTEDPTGLWTAVVPGLAVPLGASTALGGVGATLRVKSGDDPLRAAGVGLLAGLVSAVPTYVIVIGGPWTSWQAAIVAAYLSASLVTGYLPTSAVSRDSPG